MKETVFTKLTEGYSTLADKLSVLNLTLECQEKYNDAKIIQLLDSVTEACLALGLMIGSAEESHKLELTN